MSEKNKSCCSATEAKVKPAKNNVRRTIVVNTPFGPKTADVINGKTEIVQG